MATVTARAGRGSTRSHPSDPGPSYAGDRLFHRRIVWTIVAIVTSAAILAGIWVARTPVLLLYVSIIAAVGLTPAIDGIERALGRIRPRAAPRWLAVLIFYLVALTVVALLIRLLWPRLVDQVGQLRQTLPSAIDRLQALLVRHGWIREPLTLADAVGSSGGGLNRPVAIAAGAVSQVMRAFADVGIVLVLTFYLLVDGPRIVAYVTGFIPLARRPDALALATDVAARVSAWLRGIAVLAMISSVTMGLVLALLREPFFYVVALVAGIGESIPIAGPIVAGSFAVAVASTQSLKLVGEVALAFLVLHEVESNILVPRIMSRQVGISSLAILFGLLVGGEWSGLAGVCLAIPTTAIIVAVLDEVRAGVPPRERMAARDRAAAGARVGPPTPRE